MLFKTRSKLLFYYRIFFIILFLVLGVSCTGLVLLENFAGISLINTSSEIDRQALYVTSSVIGALGLFTALIMIYLMREKRSATSDRRQHQKPMDFIDRRSEDDRRSDSTYSGD